MRHRSKWLVAVAVLIVWVSDLSATSNCPPVTIGGLTACWAQGSDIQSVPCPNGQTCGSIATSVLVPTTFNGTTGWHNYAPSAATTAQQYLNNLSTSSGAGITFALSANSNLQEGSVVDSWRAPTADNGYYLETSGNSPTSTESVMMTFGSDDGNGGCTGCLNQFALYWGSLDSWNTITFTPWSGSAISLTGMQIASGLELGTLGQNDTASFVLDFQVADGHYWKSVTLSSTYAAFEFDNIAWDPVNCNPCAPTASSFSENAAPAAVPEPSSLILLCTSILGAAEWRRRNGFSQG